MILKRPLNSHRLRSTPPAGFGWIDHRLLRNGYFRLCSPQALALYSLLICAGDAHGLSFYSEPRTAELLGLDAEELRRARRELIDAELIAFQKPLYQVLSLEGAQKPNPGCRRLSAPARTATALPAPTSPPVRKRLLEAASPQFAPAPAGLDLRAMVKASLKKGGAQ